MPHLEAALAVIDRGREQRRTYEEVRLASAGNVDAQHTKMAGRYSRSGAVKVNRQIVFRACFVRSEASVVATGFGVVEYEPQRLLPSWINHQEAKQVMLNLQAVLGRNTIALPGRGFRIVIQVRLGRDRDKHAYSHDKPDGEQARRRTYDFD